MNIPSSILYGARFSELQRIARSTLRLADSVPKASQIYTIMVTQGGNKTNILRQIKKYIPKYPKTFLKYCKIYDKRIKKKIMY